MKSEKIEMNTAAIFEMVRKIQKIAGNRPTAGAPLRLTAWGVDFHPELTRVFHREVTHL